MTYQFTKAQAEDYANYLNERMVGTLTKQAQAVIARYVVERYTGTDGWGVIEKWRYVDQPDGYEYGGAFMWSDHGELPRPMY